MAQSPQAFWLEHLDQAGSYIDWVFEETRPHLGRSVLEVGCGTGTYTALLGGLGARVVAMDLDESFVRIARAAVARFPDVEVVQGDVTRQTWTHGFDTVVMLDVLEHLDDDLGMLRKLASALEPGGRIVLKVPAFRWLHGTLDDAVGHFRRYDRDGLVDLLARAGFRAPRAWYFNAAAVPGWWLNGKLLRRTTPPASQLKLMDRLVPVLRAVDRVTRPIAGLSLFATGERT